MNQKGELDLAGEADKIIEQEASEGGGDSTESPDAESEGQTGDSEGDGQPEKDPETPEAAKEDLSPEKVMEELGKLDPNADLNKATDKEFLKSINSVGAIHNGELIEVKDRAHLKELIQKGHDYTKNSMDLSNRVKEVDAKELGFKEREESLAAWEKDNASELLTGELLSAALAKIKQSDPDLFEEINKAYTVEEANHQANKSIFDKYEGRIKELESNQKRIDGKSESQKLKEVQTAWGDQKKTAQEKLTKDLSKIGVKVDWDGKVFEAWKADAANTKTVEQAVYEIYGQAIIAGHKSYANLLKSKTKTQQSKNSRGAGGSGASSGETPKEYRPGDYGSILKDGAANL